MNYENQPHLKYYLTGKILDSHETEIKDIKETIVNLSKILVKCVDKLAQLEYHLLKNETRSNKPEEEKETTSNQNQDDMIEKLSKAMDKAKLEVENCPDKENKHKNCGGHFVAVDKKTNEIITDEKELDMIKEHFKNHNILF